MLQDDLYKVVEWAQKWKMEFNVEKCKIMHNKRHKMKNTVLNVTTYEWI